MEDKKQVNPEEETVNEEVKEEGEAEILEEKADAKKEPEKKSKKQTKKQKDEEIEALKLEVEAMKEKMLRNQAELQNFKRRMNDERIKERKFANAEFAKSLLPILDNFDLALQKEKESSNLKGFEMIQRDLL
uniref:nucleotide exchange factor GrpE n=1 Tax=Methanocalculus natronophilus TaxID=1262400 RepID=UPI0031B5A320